MKDQGTYTKYERALRDRLWAWSDAHHPTHLDGGDRESRPPVLSRQYRYQNLILPPDRDKAEQVLLAVPYAKRHRWFGSLKSSQAIAQSVFGAIQAFDALDLLTDLKAECGRPACAGRMDGGTLELEHEVKGLQEPRPTSIDVLTEGPEYRIAVECKLTEREFGRCSRPGLDPEAPEHCDGSYRVQHARRSRCALTELGIRYWELIPDLFEWPAGRDHQPCPFGETYQIGRNALAATLGKDGRVHPTRGHVLLVYDGRNPEFGLGGQAQQQWERAQDECEVLGLLRRTTWQKIAEIVGRTGELGYLVDALKAKYGVQAEEPTECRT